MNKDIETAIAMIRETSLAVDKPQRYYDGRHDLAFATEKFKNTFGSLFREFALNLCPIICDAVRDKLRVTGFSFDRMSYGLSRDQAITPESETPTRDIWNRNRMATRSGTVHKEALVCGNAYLLVWPDASGRSMFYPNQASQIAIKYDEDEPGRINWAAKVWTDALKRIRLNIFYPDRIERYVSKAKTEGLPEAKAMLPFASDDARSSVIANPYGVVPVFHFANNADLGALGRSEIEAAMPVQDGLNKSVLDMLVAMEFSAFRQRWASGIEVDYDAEGKTIAPFDTGVDHLWITGSPNARFGDFESAQLDQFLKVKDSFRIDMASVTGTPLHYFLQNNAGLPSGEALKKSETRFIAKVRDRQENFGQVWADAMSFALRIEGRDDAQLITQWEDPSPVSEREFLENILLKRQIGLPINDALLEAGYGTADVERMSEPEAVATGSA
jgi:hypothetical protein